VLTPRTWGSKHARKRRSHARFSNKSSMYSSYGYIQRTLCKFTATSPPNPMYRVSGQPCSCFRQVNVSGHNSRIPYLFFLGAFASFSCRRYQCSPLCSERRSLQSSLPGANSLRQRGKNRKRSGSTGIGSTTKPRRYCQYRFNCAANSSTRGRFCAVFFGFCALTCGGIRSAADDSDKCLAERQLVASSE